MTDRNASTGDMGRFARKLTDRELDQVLGGQAPDEEGDLQQLASFVRDARAVLGQAPDEETAARHLAAMSDMARDADTAVIASAGPTPWRRGPSSQRERSRVMSRKLLAIVSAVVLVGLLSGAAYAGVLPGPVQRAVADVAGNLGVALPGSNAENDIDEGEVNEVDDGQAGDIEQSQVGNFDEGATDDTDEGEVGEVDEANDVHDAEVGDVDEGDVDDSGEGELEDSDDGDAEDSDEGASKDSDDGEAGEDDGA